MFKPGPRVIYTCSSANIVLTTVVGTSPRGKPDVLHQTVCDLLHTVQFCENRKVRYQPYGPWEHIPDGIWSSQCIAIPSEEQDGPDAPRTCALNYRRGFTECDPYNFIYCEGCGMGHSC